MSPSILTCLFRSSCLSWFIARHIWTEHQEVRFVFLKPLQINDLSMSQPLYPNLPPKPLSSSTKRTSQLLHWRGTKTNLDTINRRGSCSIIRPHTHSKGLSVCPAPLPLFFSLLVGITPQKLRGAHWARTKRQERVGEHIQRPVFYLKNILLNFYRKLYA